MAATSKGPESAPEEPGITDPDIIHRFITKVDVDYSEEGCWEWQAGRVNDDDETYGCFRVGDDTVLAHRVSYRIHFGTIPEGTCVLHAKDHPPCTNPRHLSLGKQEDNLSEAANKGNMGYPRGIDRHDGLSATEVREIRRLRNEEGLTYEAIADKIGTTHKTVGEIIRGEIYDYVD